MILFLDTTNNQKVFLKIGRKATTIDKSEDLLGAIESLLNKSGYTMDDISAIEINTGPGSFTGLRIGLTIANVWGWFKKIKINGHLIASGNFILPKYE
ncbi:hypothetical protein KBI33_00775 [Candidatus Shapirobacteria bacterium]|nr:hypothetical protein [Candidatus Shapirobacteria bacterium]